jgi:hypothetical protein
MLVWVVPLLVALEQYWASADTPAQSLGDAITASPIGSVGFVWKVGHNVWIGIAVQAAEVFVLLVLSEVVFRVRKPRAIPIPAVVAA